MPQIRQTAHVSRRAVAWRNTGPWRHLTGAGATLVAGAMIVAAGPTPGMAAATAAPRPGFRAALDQTSRPRLRAALDQTSRPRLRAALEQTSHLGFRAELERIVDDGIPGVVGLARRGGHAVTAASGDADIAAAQPMAVDDRFRAGSITKTMVATVVLQLVGEHRLGLSDSVARWLPGLVPDGQDITVRELLQHTSGLFDFVDDAGFLQAFEADPTRVWQPRALVRIAVAHPPQFPPGTNFAYSNTDYLLLGLIIQAATGQSLDQELRDRIFIPLGLRHTSLPFTQVTPPSPYAHGYLLGQASGPLDITQVSPSWAWAAGAVVSTAADLAHFYAALLTGRLLPPPLLREMLTTVPTGTAGARYGLGIFSLQTPCGPAWGHNGAFPGYYSNAFTSRSGDRQVMVLVNANYKPLTTQQNTDIAIAVFTGVWGGA